MEINAKKLKGILEKQRKEHQKYTDAKFEQHEKRVDAKFEEYKKHTDTKFEQHEKRVDAKFEEYKKHTDAKFEEIKTYFDVVREDFGDKVQLIAEQYDSIIDKLNSHEARIVSIEKNIEIMKIDIAFIKNSLKKKIDIEEFEVLERRVAILETKVR